MPRCDVCSRVSATCETKPISGRRECKDKSACARRVRVNQPTIEGSVKSVSSADIHEVIRLKQQDMVKEYGKVLPIYTVRVHSHNHIEVQYWGPDGVEFWRDARRVKGRWKFDELVPVIVS